MLLINSRKISDYEKARVLSSFPHPSASRCEIRDENRSPKHPFPPWSQSKWFKVAEEANKSYKSFAVFGKYQPVFYRPLQLIPVLQQTGPLYGLFYNYLIPHTLFDPQWEGRNSEITTNKSWRVPPTPTPQWRLLCLPIDAEISPRLEAMRRQKNIAE